MSSIHGEDVQDQHPEAAPEDSEPELAEVEALESETRAERPNFLTSARFVDFELPQEIMDGLDAAGFEYCTPIQAQAIPVAMEGYDIAGQAQTGTGKTTAFLVPLLNRLLKTKPLKEGCPRALIVTPTRELAQQVYEDCLVLARHTGFKSVLVIGGIEYQEQAALLNEAPEIVICTPGRLIDYLQQGIFHSKGVEVAVVDEADRLLDMGFIKDLKYLLGKLPPYTQRQTMLFSATLDQRVLELTYEFMNPPQFITAEPNRDTKVNIEQELYHIGRDEKLSLLLGLLRREEHRRVIIFCNTKSGVEWLAKKLTMNGFQAEGITGDLPQPKRIKLMDAFKENRLQILVATDVASRGIHVDDVSHVYNYDLPQDAENYVHRIGRTARAGNSGKAVSFGCEDYVFHLEAIENLLGEKIPVAWPDPELFQEDKGGEVRTRERERRDVKGRGGRGESKGRGVGGGREENGDPRRRGPAKSQLPGGIFGLSPRYPILGEDAVGRGAQKLSWTPDEIAAPPLTELAEEAPEIESAEPLTDAAAAPDDAKSEVLENGKDKDGRRKRKRRRGRGRDRDHAGQEGQALEAEGAEGAAEPGVAEEKPAPVVMEAPAIEAAAKNAAPEKIEADKSGRGKGRGRQPSRPAKAQAGAPAEEPIVMECAATENSAVLECVPSAAEAAPEKPARAAKKPAARKPAAKSKAEAKADVADKAPAEGEAAKANAAAKPKTTAKPRTAAKPKAGSFEKSAAEKPAPASGRNKAAPNEAGEAAKPKAAAKSRTAAKPKAAKPADKVETEKPAKPRAVKPKTAKAAENGAAAEEKPKRSPRAAKTPV